MVGGSGVGLVDRGRGVVGRGGVDSLVAGLVGRGTSSGGVLLLIVVLVDLIGLGRGLAHNSGVGDTMGLVDRGVDSGSIALLDGLVAVLVSGSKGQEGEDGDESLKKYI